MILNDKKIRFIDQEVFRLLNLIEETNTVKEPAKKQAGSIAHSISIDWTDKIVDSPMLEFETVLKEIVSVKQSYKGKTIGFNAQNYLEFKKFVAHIDKEQNVANVISRKFIEEKSIEWIFTTYRNQKASTNFSTYIIDEMENSIEELKVHHLMLNIDIKEPFQIGNVHFEFFTKEYFDKLSRDFQAKKPGADNYYEAMREQYQGRVFATYIVRAEPNKAKEIALRECSLAVDILKMCSQTLDVPHLKNSFDIDSRVRENGQNKVIIMNTNNLKKMRVTMSRGPNHHTIDDSEWKKMLNRQIADFHNFLLELNKDGSELKQLIVNAIKRFGTAISNSDLHQRTVELFTILESLLLFDKNSPIIDSVCRYSSKLVFKQPDERKELISLLKRMYEVRSALIHHAKQKEFDLNDLRKLQYTVVLLLVSLIRKSTLHKTKVSILKEIDDAILAAY